MSIRTRRIVLVTLVLVGLVVMGLWLQRSRTRSALERYKAELRAKGEKLTFTELGVPRTTNGLRHTDRLIAAIARLPGGSMSPGNLEIMEYASAGRARVAWESEALETRTISGGYATNNWQNLIDAVASAEPALREIREAITTPDLDLGEKVDLFNLPQNPIVQKRNAAHWLMGATIAALHKHDLDLAMTNLRALVALTRVHREELTLVNQMIRRAIAGLGLETTWEALQANGWTDVQLAALQSDWEAVNLLEALEKGFLGDRALFTGMMELKDDPRFAQTASSPDGDSLREIGEGVIAWLMWQPAGDELFYLQNIQVIIEGIRSLQSGKSWPEVKTQLDESAAERDRLLNSPFKYRYLLTLIAMPNFGRAVPTVLRNETLRQLTLAAIAIRRFELRHGQPPSSLAALVPEFLARIPHDYMNGQPLGYHVNADGDFTLYSVGFDGRDDGGDPRPHSSTNSFGLWQGRDAVWPKAVLKDNPAPAR